MKRLRTMVVTVSRADYGLLYPLIVKLNEDTGFETIVTATGNHLSQLHGNTIQKLQDDGIVIGHMVEMPMTGDTGRDVCNSMAAGLSAFSDILAAEKPDLIIVLGDRYELWPVCMSAAIFRVPVAHIHGGEVTYGAVDEVIRHSVTKMSLIHFPSIDLYRQRIIQMGESPDRVFAVGALGIDNVRNIELMNKRELSLYTGADFENPTAIMTYHPVTLDDYDSASQQVKEVLEALLASPVFTIVTMPNSDVGGTSVYKTIYEYAEKYSDRFKIIKNLGQKAYLSTMEHARFMIGNSSSGIIESASFKLPVVNIGDRQQGRFKPNNVIDCICSRGEIINAIKKALSEDFIQSVSGMKNPYGDGKTAERIVDILKSFDFRDKNLLKKKFYNKY
ncbi:MAG: UDP-N-acetylglucosamine 2-epimerase [Clostridia bacterium]|nr:UDP-N-acetylglucosamine 2-epimerase [Clostridia bacterium]